MKLVILESPYAGEIARNVNYARECVRHSLNLGEAPIASHLLYTQPGILHDHLLRERALGIRAGLAWRSRADYSVFYIDYGFSSGMRNALDEAVMSQSPFRIRAMKGRVHLPPGLEWLEGHVDVSGKIIYHRDAA